MKSSTRFTIVFGLCSYFFILFFTSCSSNKNLAYFKNIPDSLSINNVLTAKYSPLIIKKDDILSISIQTLDPTVTINQPTTPITNVNNNLNSTSPTGISPTQNGYLVDNEGFIDFPIIGKIKVAGLTTSQALELLKSQAEKYYKNPTVTLRFSNFKVSIMGEVNKPSVYVFPNERVSVLDALSYAGDLTAYGKRANILLIREIDSTGNKDFIRLNLNSTDFLSSPYFYLKQNDMIYVPPTKSKEVASDVALSRALIFVPPLTSLLILLISKIK